MNTLWKILCVYPGKISWANTSPTPWFTYNAKVLATEQLKQAGGKCLALWHLNSRLPQLCLVIWVQMWAAIRGGLYLFDDLYSLTNNQLQLVFVHGAVCKRHLAFPRLFHLLGWKNRDKESPSTSTNKCKVYNLLVMPREKLELNNGVFSLIGGRVVNSQQVCPKTTKHLAWLIHIFNTSNPSKALFYYYLLHFHTL